MNTAFMKPKFHRRRHNSHLSDYITCQFNSIQLYMPFFPKTHFNLSPKFLSSFKILLMNSVKSVAYTLLPCVLCDPPICF